MLNCNENPLAFYWSHYQPINTIEDFIEYLEIYAKQMIIDTVSHIKHIISSLYETITSKKYLLGYCRIIIIFKYINLHRKNI